MEENESYKWVGSKNGIAGVAWISLVVDPYAYNEIIEEYVPQEYPNFPYDDWKLSARNGIKYALSFCDAHWKVSIKNMVGHILHTNSCMVAYTAARALWNKIGYIPAASEINKLETFVYNNWDNREQLVAVLETLTLIRLEDCA